MVLVRSHWSCCVVLKSILFLLVPGTQTLRGLLPLDAGEDACISQQLAMPKTDGDKARVWILQKQFTDGEKGWLGILA